MIAVIGCGNPARSDDGAGCVVAQALQSAVREHQCMLTRVYDAGTDGMSVMFRARGIDRLILVDAARADGPPGSIYRVPGARLTAAWTPSLNLHDFRWEHALYAGRQIFGEAFPDDVTVYLIEAASLEYGLSLTPSVQAAVKSVVDEILDLILHHECTAEAAA